MEIENLMCDKEDMETTIQQLHTTTDELEVINKKSVGIVKERTSQFIKEMETEIEWNEQILNEINSSIQFEEMRDKK